MAKAIVYLALWAVLLGGAVFLPSSKKARRFGVTVLLFALLGEVFLCNFHSFHLLGGDYSEQPIEIGSDGAELQTNANRITLTLQPDRRVGTVAIELAFSGSATHADVTVDACDETQSATYRTAVANGTVIKGNARSAVIVLDLSGTVSSLRLRITADEADTVTLTGITLNKPVPFSFSPLRLCLFAGVLLLLYLLLCSPAFTASYGENRSLGRRAITVILMLSLLCCLGAHMLCRYDRTGGILDDFHSTSGNQISQELVDAFEAGQVSLIEEPDPDLLELENPYDWSLRSASGVSAKWDHLLYNGKYYSYYGIAPVLLLFLPYHLITGYYFPTPTAVLLFCMLGVLFLSLLFLEFCERFGKRLPINMLLSTMVVLLASCGVLYNIASPLFYEIAQSSGFCFVCAGFWLLLRSGVVGEAHGRPRKRALCLSSVCLSLAVLCRPTLALYCVTALFFIGYGLARDRQALLAQERNAPIRTAPATLAYLAAALLPFALLGGLQMAYNYARFGSFLDFGIQYSLTINDFTRSEYHTDLAAIGFYNFLLAVPILKPVFPYVFSNFSTLDVNGYYFVANRNAVGLFFRALPSLGWLGILPAWRTLNRSERCAALLLLLPVCLIAPLGIIFSIWESGYGVRYCADFAWQFVLGGACVLFVLYLRRAEQQTQRLMQTGFCIAAVLSLVCNFAMLYDYFPKTGNLESTYLSFARIFDFWL